MQGDSLLSRPMNCLYLHIPFCQSKCFYCSFNSYPGQEHLHRRYCRALKDEIRTIETSHTLDSLFIGGGTPTVLETGLLVDLLNVCADHFGFSERAEISIEANPETVDSVSLRDLRAAGFNRVSFGVQSFDDQELKKLGRIHTGAGAFGAVNDAFSAGLSNVSLDLMYGLPGQTVKSWRKTLDRGLELAPQHLSIYQLSIEEDTEYFHRAGDGSLEIPGEEAVLAMDDITNQRCHQAGFGHYEISNYSRPGYRCNHNLNYWHNDPYLACGAGAVSYQDGARELRVRNPEQYCRAVEQREDFIAEREKLPVREAFKETVIMGLRLIEGVSERRLQKRFGMSLTEVYPTELDRLIDQRLLSFEASQLVLTERGRRLANQVMAELV